MTTPPSSAVLDRLRAVPGGFGQPSFASLLAAILADAEAQAAAVRPAADPAGDRRAAGRQEHVPVRADLAGDSTSPPDPLSGAERGSSPPLRAERGSGGEVLRPYLIRWGDTIRGGKRRGVVAQERQFGDLTPQEFAGTSGLLAEAARAAGAAAVSGGGPAVVVVEAPGMTMLTGPDGQRRGLDRGYTLARELAADPHGYLLALCADHQVREANLGGRHAQITAGGPEIREATQLAANRIRQQVTDVLFELGSAGTIPLPAPLPESPLTRESLDRHPGYRNEAVLRAYLPYLLRDDLHFPPERAFIGLNAFVEGAAPPDTALMDRYDWTHEHFGV